MTRLKTNIPLLLLTTLALLAAHVGSASAAWPGANGSLVFAGYDPGGEETSSASSLGIYSAPLEGGREDLRPLSPLDTDTEPAVSPDGRSIAFLRTTGAARPGSIPTAAIYTMSLDGSAQRAVTDGSGRDIDPTFSASGKQIFFSRLSGGQHIYSVSSSGGAPRQITSAGADTEPVASPNGRLIAFVRRQEGPRRQHIFVARPSGAHAVDITPRLGSDSTHYASDPDFSPDGRQIAFVENDSLLVTVRPNGSFRRVLTHRAPEGSRYRHPAYSPDGRFLIFAKIDSDTGRSSLLRLHLKRHRFAPNPLTRPHLSIQAAVWSPVR